MLCPNQSDCLSGQPSAPCSKGNFQKHVLLRAVWFQATAS